MPRDNVEIVRRVIEAHDRGDFAAVFAAYHPRIEWHIARVMAPVGDFEPIYHGHEGIRAFWRQWFAAWEIASFEYEDFIEVGDSVVTILSQRMRGRRSGVELDWTSYAQVWTVQEGKIVRVEFFPTRGEAIEAVGLRE
jgi:ketosteroid isomerase-like protein